ncbi:hypothetical protein L3K57_15775 (plasmid) [Enterococcus faecium]|uniref:hypothetical protein n=1 Tax=Enterococcus faecium TaxID=1352 RepID=UPI001F47350E|nr:hypothetical protein [Enterococcus faecium]UJV65263.1 hypothetical protein L3K57_15775 [Enterococcus faecium]
MIDISLIERFFSQISTPQKSWLQDGKYPNQLLKPIVKIREASKDGVIGKGSALEKQKT